jgi:hypothetical protein
MAALLLPRLLDRVPDRPVMLSGAGLLAAALLLRPAGVHICDQGVGLARLTVDVGGARRRLLGRHDSIQTFATTLGTCSRPSGGLCRSVRPFARLLAFDLSTCWLAWLGGGNGADGAGAQRDHVLWHPARSHSVACVGRRCSSASPS